MKPVYYCGHLIGAIDGGVYITDRRPSHFMAKYQGFGISSAVIEYIAGQGAERVRVVYHGATGRKVWECPLSAFASSQKRHIFKPKFGAEDVQHFMSTADMLQVYPPKASVRRTGGEALPVEAEESAPPVAAETLFNVAPPVADESFGGYGKRRARK